MKQCLILIFLLSCCSMIDYTNKPMAVTAAEIAATVLRRCQKQSKPLHECFPYWREIVGDVFERACDKHHFSERQRQLLNAEVREGLQQFLEMEKD